MKTDLQFIRGNSQTVHLKVLDAEGNNVIRDDDALYFTAKPEYDCVKTDEQAPIRKNIKVSEAMEPETGIITFELTAEDTDQPTGNYVYDLVLDRADGNRRTLLEGKLAIRPAVTLRGISDAK